VKLNAEEQAALAKSAADVTANIAKLSV
jgi:hypothetical protein